MPEIMSLSNITALKFAESPMRILKGLTFMYNSNWSPDGTNSLPFAFYHVVKQEEVVRNEVSQKRVILHKFSYDTNPKGALSVISDNIVPQPKIWRLTVLVPMKSLLPFLDEALSRAEAGLAFTSTYFRGAGHSNIANAADIAASGVAIIRLLTKLFDFGQNVALWATSAFGAENIADYNKISLEKMSYDRSIICMKDWSGWTYKYGVITNCSLSKEPLDEEYYKGTIEFQEMPVLLSTPYKLPNTVTIPSATQAIFTAIRPAVEGVLLR